MVDKVRIIDPRNPFRQGLVYVPSKYHPTIGDILSNRYLRGDVQTPQKGTFTNP